MQKTLADLQREFYDERSDGADIHGATIVSGTKVRWRREFNDPTLAEWDLVLNDVPAPVVANGSVAFVMNTNVGSSFSLTSKRSFEAPFKFQFGFILSQKIANNEFYVEIVAELPDASGVDESVVAAWRISGTDSTTVTNARVEVRNGGAARIQSSNITSNSSQTTAAGALYEIVLESDEVWFHSRTADSVANKSAGGAVRNTTAPDPNYKYRVRVRGVNGAVAPASATTFTGFSATVVDYSEIQVQITGSDGSQAGAQSLPVNVVSSTTVTSIAHVSAVASATYPGSGVTKINSAATTNATSVRTAVGKLYGVSLYNNGAAAAYFKVFNKATAPTPGTDVPIAIFGIAPNSFRDIALPWGGAASAGVGYTITGGAADTDTTAVALSQVVGALYSL